MWLTHTSLNEDCLREKVKGNILEVRSDLHLEARKILAEILPLAQIIEEAKISIYGKNPPVYFDFFIPINSLFIEVQGSQHYTYSRFFHKNKRQFSKSIKRDRDKKLWCDLNNFKLIQLRFDEKEKWTQILTSKK